LKFGRVLTKILITNNLKNEETSFIKREIGETRFIERCVAEGSQAARKARTMTFIARHAERY